MTAIRQPLVPPESHVVPLYPVTPQPRDQWPTHNLGRELADLGAQRGGGDGAVVRKLPTVTPLAFITAQSPWPYWLGLVVLLAGCAVWTWRGER